MISLSKCLVFCWRLSRILFQVVCVFKLTIESGQTREDKQQMQEMIVSRTTRHLWAAAEKNGLAGDRQLTWRKMSFTGTVVQWLCVDGVFLH